MAKRRPHFPVRPGARAPYSGLGRDGMAAASPQPGAQFYLAERHAAFRILDQHGGVSRDSVLALAQQAQEWLTGPVASVWSRPGVVPVACQETCAWCCSLAVSAWPLELFALAAWIEARRAPEALAALRDRLAAAVAEGDRQRAAAPDRARRVACPLLEGGRCGVYPARPAACVGWNSTNAALCQAFTEGDDQARATVEPLRFFSARGVAEAAAAAVAARGGPAFTADGHGPGGAVDLPAGLLAVLERGAAEAAGAWLSGSPFLDAARERMERPALPPNPA